MARFLAIDKQSPQTAKKLAESSMILQGWSSCDVLKSWIVEHSDVLDRSLKIVADRADSDLPAVSGPAGKNSLLALADTGEVVLIVLQVGRAHGVDRHDVDALRGEGITRRRLGEAHLGWLRRQGRTNIGLDEAEKALDEHVAGMWSDELLNTPRIILVAEMFDDPDSITGRHLLEAAPGITLEAHEYRVVDHGEQVIITFRRAHPTADGTKQAPHPDERSATPEAQLAENHRRAQVVPLIHQAGAIPDASRIRLDLGQHVAHEQWERVTAWLNADARRHDVRWRSHRSQPLLWAASADPDKQWTPKGLLNEILDQAAGDVPGAPRDFFATDAWVHGGRSLYSVAQNHAK